jgi:hypothetical protein
MASVRDIIIPIITVAVTVILGGSGLVDFVNSYYNQPNVFIAVEPDNRTTDSTATINVTNRSSAPATNLKLTINAPGVIDDHDVNGTENYKEIFDNSTSLVLDIPRLVHGQGSIIEIILELKNISSTGSGNYTAYATYDQGSFRVDVPAIQAQQTLSSPQGLSNLADPLRLIIIAVIALVLGLVLDRIYKKLGLLELSKQVRKMGHITFLLMYLLGHNSISQYLKISNLM